MVWKILSRLGKAITRALGPEAVSLLGRSTSVSAFTNFPVGLAILPGDTAPLVCRVPVSLLPVQPLTRCLQHELLRRPFIYLRQELRVLIAECLSPSDRIRPYSMRGWALVQEIVRDHPGAVCEIVEIASPEELREHLKGGRYQILILSAHGHYDTDLNMATLVIGNKSIAGPELGPMPPLVILSACHTAPRGRSAVSVADLLFAGGASAVLGTLVPIEVRRNAMSMVRLFTYVMETIRGTEQHRTFDEIWHRVATSNAVNEVLSASESLNKWATAGGHEKSVIHEFMRVRSKGSLRRGHIYEDTEAVLQEIANERGIGRRFRATMVSQRYIPESVFYTFVGRPDRIVLADDSIDEIIAAGGDPSRPSGRGSDTPSSAKLPR